MQSQFQPVRAFVALVAFSLTLIVQASSGRLQAQESPATKAAELPTDGLVVRPPPPPLEKFETDIEPADGRPDGWYNDRGATIVSPGHDSDRGLKLENDKPGRPARISRAFGVDGRKYRGLRVAAWVRVRKIGNGEHQGEDPSILVDFLNSGLTTSSRAAVGPFNAVTIGEDEWLYVAKVLPVKPSARDAIMTVGLMGATGSLEIDSMELTLIPREVKPVENLIPNPDLDLGDMKPDHWLIEGSARRSSPGYESSSCLELGRGTGRALVGLGRKVDDLRRLKLSLIAKPQGVKSGGNGGVVAGVFFVDDRGATVLKDGPPFVLKFGGTSQWTQREVHVDVPADAVGAILQFDKIDNSGTLLIDKISLTDAENPANGQWRPGDVPLTEESDTWPAFGPIAAIEPGSVLDTTKWGLAAPTGHLSVKQGRLVDTRDVPARLWGVSLLPTAGYPDAAHAAGIADNLHRLGVNVVRFGDLDYAFGPGRSLIDDIFEDTGEIDPVSWARLDQFQAELAKRGIYYSIEMHSQRRFRVGDGVPEAGLLPSGGGAAAIFDPLLTQKIDDLSLKILKQERPVRGVTLALDAHLAWVTEMGEISLTELENGIFTPSERQIEVLKEAQKTFKANNTKKLHHQIESQRVSDWAKLMHREGLKAPIAGVGHWQRDQDWLETLGAPGLSVIEDRFYWPVQPWAQPGYRGSLFDATRSLVAIVNSKRTPEQAYVIGQWCAQVSGGWALPTEAADIIFGAYAAKILDVDALVRRGLAQKPQVWGASATGTAGDRDIFQLSESLSGMPQALAMMPHVASILRRDRGDDPVSLKTKAAAKTTARTRPVFGNAPLEGWEPTDGIVHFVTPHTAGLAGRLEFATSEQTTLGFAEFETNFTNGVVIASSATGKDLAATDRMLVTVMGRAIPSGFRYADQWQKDVAEFGEPPLRIEPVTAKFRWNGTGKIQVFQVDNNGHRGKEVEVLLDNNTQIFTLDGTNTGPHWEIVIKR